MSDKRCQVNFRVGPKLKELIHALSETSGQSTGRVFERAIFELAISRVKADVLSCALKPSESKIDIASVRHDFSQCYARLTELLLEAYSHRLDCSGEAETSSTSSGHPPTAETERDSDRASAGVGREIVIGNQT